MRKKVFILLIVLSLVLAVLPIPLSNANPPTEPKVVGVKVTILSPKNNEIISTNNLQVNFTVDVPAEQVWSLGYSTKEFVPKETMGTARVVLDKYPFFVERYPIKYTLPETTVNYCFNLTNLPQGQHSLFVEVSYSFSDSNVQIDLVGSTQSAKTNITVLGAPFSTLTPEVISPNVNRPDINQNLFPAIVSFLVIIALASVSLVYFKRHKKNKLTNKQSFL